jgi:hypothetical protein
MAGDDTSGVGARSPLAGHRPEPGEPGAHAVAVRAATISRGAASRGERAEFRATAVQLIGEEAAEQAVAGAVVVR